MEKMQIAISRLLLSGVFLSTLIVLFGGALYLAHDGNSIVHYSVLINETARLGYLQHILSRALTLSPLDVIELGLLSFVFVQILRVALTAWLFLRMRDFIFFWISLFILAVLIYSFFGPH